MNLFLACLYLVGGLVVLWKSAGLLVSGAVGLARRLGISSLVMGLTVVAMGTSAPEVAASIAAALRGAGDIAIGNVYGSNIANLALVGGICGLIRPIRVQIKTLSRELPVMLLVVLLLLPVLYNLQLSRGEGAFLLVVFLILMVLTVCFARKEAGRQQQTAERRANESLDKQVKIKGKSLTANIVLIVAGLIGLALGAEATVHGAVFIGERIGLSKAVIGLTIIAVGTSLPELMTCVVAAMKGHDDISIGNLVGSNIFNTLLVTGTAGMIRPFSIVSRLAGVDYWIMVGVSGAFVLMAILGKRISKRDGIVLLSLYGGYMVYLLCFTAGV